MTAQNPPAFLQAGSHGSELVRRAFATLLNPAGGVVNTSDLVVAAHGTPNMSVDVAGGRPGGEAWIPGSSSGTVIQSRGLYYVYNDGTQNLLISASNPSNPRKDEAVGQIEDAAYSGSNNDWKLAIVTGTPAASPVAPTLPDSSLQLAEVLVGAGVTSITSGNITDKRVFALSGGGQKLAGNADSGWVNPANGSYANSWANGTAPLFPFGYRKIGNRVTLRGTLTGGGSTTTLWGSIPSGIGPVNTTNIQIQGVTTTGAPTTTSGNPMANIISTGQMAIYFTAVSGLAYFDFDGVSYLID